MGRSVGYGIYFVKAGIGKKKAALLVVIGVQRDGNKRFLALEPGHRESKQPWPWCCDN
jgi:transposase-like protein